jgi:hypothetical protein
MSELHRLKRVFGSWIGKLRHRKLRRTSVYEFDDALLILTDLGMLMSPEALEYVSGNSTRREDFLQQIYMSEDELGIDLIQDNVRIDPQWNPLVREEGNKIAITIIHRGEELIVAEWVKE